MSRDPLYEAVLGAIMFLELSGPDIVDEDAAVGAMEQMAHDLQQLGAEDKARFLDYVGERAKEAERPQERELLEQLPDALGLV